MLGKKHFNDKEKKALAEEKKIGGLRGWVVVSLTARVIFYFMFIV
jgi:hypothetical protein